MIKIKCFGLCPLENLIERKPCSEDVFFEVKEIIDDVRKRGDEALRDYALRFSGAALSSLEVTKDEINDALYRLKLDDPRFLEVLKRAYRNIKEFHEKELRTGFSIKKEGKELGIRVVPIERVGIYIPGGEAPLSSTVLMDVTPAKIAGVSEVILITSPLADGSVSPYILGAAAIAGADRVFKCSGAQAIAALAFGTETIPRVDKIVGPGSKYVAEAKRQVFGRVGIDMVAGPSEIMIIADAKNDPAVLALDMLSQAEHDSDASSVLITDSMEMAEKTAKKIEESLSLIPREKTARSSIDSHGLIIVVPDIEDAVEIANYYGPEHLELMVDEPYGLLERIKNAGSVFLGRFCPEALGDYMAGPNHTLPTGGSARFFSPLSVDDFMKKTQYIYYTAEALGREADDISYFARSEGLEAHALSALSRSAYT